MLKHFSEMRENFGARNAMIIFGIQNVLRVYPVLDTEGMGLHIAPVEYMTHGTPVEQAINE